MHAAQKISIKLVTEYLIQAASISNGATLKDIINFTGVSESSVRRVIKKHPAIIRLEIPGRESKYYLDQEKMMNSLTPEKDDGKVPLIKTDQAFIDTIQNMSIVEFAAHLRALKFDESKLNFQLMTQNAVDFQEGKDSLNPEIARKGRIGIDNLLQFNASMIAYLKMVRQHPEYMSDENWWAIWPKD